MCDSQKCELQKAPYCYHCGAKMEIMNSPSIHLKESLDWEGDFLWICANDRCPVFISGFSFQNSLMDEVLLFRSVVDPATGGCALAPVAPMATADIGEFLKKTQPNIEVVIADNSYSLDFLEEDWRYMPNTLQ